MRWGILGAGNIANKFAETIQKMQQAGEDEQLTAVASRDLKKAEAYAEKYGAVHAFGSYEEMLACPEVDAVYIATPNNLHFAHSKLCPDAGKHVLCEKPFTTNVDDAKALYEMAQQKHLFIMEAFWIRFLPLLIRMREIIESGEIGTVKFARSDYGFYANEAKRGRKFDASLGGGALLDIGVYNLGFMHIVMGGTALSFSSDVHLNEFGVDDFSVIELKYASQKQSGPAAYENGGAATAVVTTAIGFNIPHRGVVVGTKGCIELPDFQKAEHMTVTKDDGTCDEIDMPFDYTGFEYQVREVGRCVAAGMSASDIYTPEDSLDTLRLMDEIRDSWGMKFPFEK